MIRFKAILHKLDNHAEKTGWTVIHIPEKTAQLINPGVKKSYRVKGLIDEFPVERVAMVPMGGGDYMIAVNAAMRKGIRKQQGAAVTVALALDERPIEQPNEFMECLADAPGAEAHFRNLAPSHQKYFGQWISSAKTDATRAKRIAAAINGLEKGWGFGEVVRAMKNDRLEF